MKSHIVKKFPVIILDFDLLFWPLSQNMVVPFQKGQEACNEALYEAFPRASPTTWREVMRNATFFVSLIWTPLPQHLLE